MKTAPKKNLQPKENYTKILYMFSEEKKMAGKTKSNKYQGREPSKSYDSRDKDPVEGTYNMITTIYIPFKKIYLIFGFRVCGQLYCLSL